MANQDLLVTGILKGGGQESRDLAEIIRTTNWNHELDWISDMFIEHSCKQTIAIGDATYLNVLVKNYQSNNQVVLIDYETATHGYRGIDIGGHFNERMYGWGNSTSSLTGYASAGVDEQQSFCTSYRQEMQALGQETTSNDTLSHLLLESQVGRLYQILFSVCMSFQSGVPEGLSQMAGLMAGLTHMMETYQGLKQRFLEDRPPC
jgi:thiamine kinase-like enzyme